MVLAAYLILDVSQYDHPILVSGTDGVGTKLKLAIDSGIHDTVGIDLVAMCVNDILVLGAEPLFFLDYYATGKLSVDIATDVINGIATGCEQAGAALIGGETAEMPGMYAEDDYDLAGFCVGVVDKAKIINGESLAEGHKLIGMNSSGIHSNGFSLVRKVLELNNVSLSSAFNDEFTFAERLLVPTRIYVKSVLATLKEHSVDAMVHVTGGGLTENIPRVLPKHLNARIDLSSWAMPEIFQWIQKHGNIATEEMLRTFNCGIGFILAVPAGSEDAVLATLSAMDEKAQVIGEITSGDGRVDYQ